MHLSRRTAFRIAALFPVALLAPMPPAHAALERAATVVTPAPASEPVWVFFRDKGLPGPEAEAAAVERAATSLTPRARARRAKVRPGAIATVLDLPLHAPYVDAVLATGARLRTRSRWLNAVSVDATPAQRAALGALPVVASVRPVARGTRTPERVTPVSASAPPGGARASLLNYGDCASQIVPIQVDLLHDAGLSGAGVLVAVMDTGFKRTHDALLSVNVVAEHDFINDDGNAANEAGDDPAQDDHGTYVLSLLAGYHPGSLIGPAFGASFALAKTEDITSETPVEEDYWVEAAEWADSLGADVISTSLSYKDWYVYDDIDGDTAPITIAADLAAANGIAVFAAAGNEGTSAWYHIAAPADGDSVITVGAVDSLDVLAAFSSRGPTFDGRTKPDVCAMGAGNLVALPQDDHGYARGSGTSFACPLAAGAAALLLEAVPSWTPVQLREALRATATNAGSPDNNLGWGVIRAVDAVDQATPVSEPAAVPPAAAAGRLAISPNPSAGVSAVRWTLPRGAAAGRLSVVDVRGRLVRDLGAVRGAAGVTEWDGRDDAGRPVPTGIWFARLETARGTVAARVVRLR